MSKSRVMTIVLGIVIIWVVYLVATCLVLRWDFGGEFRDTFGALNALFSGLAMGGVIVAIFMQRQELIHQRDELILQREELKLTREELSRSAEAHEGQTQALTQQYRMLLTTAQINGYTAHQGHGGTVVGVNVRIRELLEKLEEDESANN